MLLLVGLALWLGACSAEDPQKQLITKKQQLSDLKAEISELEKQIAAAEGKDPSDSYKLVEALNILPSRFEHFVEVQGNVTSEASVNVTPEISGVLLRKPIQEGQSISQGQVLAVLDTELLQSQKAPLVKQLELADAIYKRQANLWKQEIGSEVQYLEAKNRKESLEKQIEQLDTQIDKGQVQAPISGTVDEFFFNVGEMANPQMPLVRVVNLGRVEIAADVSEAYLGAIGEGDTVEVRFPSLGMRAYERVSTVGQFINPNNRSFKVEVSMRNDGNRLKPNTTAVVRINDYTNPNALVVPSNLIQQSAQGTRFIYTLEQQGGENIARKTIVKVGRTFQGLTEVTSGLKGNTLVIRKGYNNVIDGERVKLTDNPKNLEEIVQADDLPTATK